MARPEVQIEGAKELRKKLRDVDRELPKQLSVIHKKTAEPVADKARSMAPQRSGTLAGSVRASGTQTAGRIAAGGARVPYAGVIHYGWPAHNIEPQPFLTDALGAQQDRIVRDYEQMIDAFIDQVFGGV